MLYIYTNESCVHVIKMIINASANSIDPGQPAQSAQAGLGQYCLLFVNEFSVCLRVTFAHDR